MKDESEDRDVDEPEDLEDKKLDASLLGVYSDWALNDSKDLSEGGLEARRPRPRAELRAVLLAEEQALGLSKSGFLSSMSLSISSAMDRPVLSPRLSSFLALSLDREVLIRAGIGSSFGRADTAKVDSKKFKVPWNSILLSCSLVCISSSERPCSISSFWSWNNCALTSKGSGSGGGSFSSGMAVGWDDTEAIFNEGTLIFSTLAASSLLSARSMSISTVLSAAPSLS